MASKRALERQTRAAKALRAAFQKSAARLADNVEFEWMEKASAFYRVAKLKNGAVDGLLRVTDLPAGKDASELIFDLGAAEVFKPPPRWKLWVSVGFIGAFEEPFGDKKEDKKRKKQGFKELTKKQRYDRFSGQSIVRAHSQSGRDLPANILAAQAIAKILETKQKKVEQVVFRVWWEPTGKRPKRTKQ